MDAQFSSTLSGFSPGFRAAKNPNAEIEMVFRFWGAAAKGAVAASEYAPASDPGVLALIQDTVASKRGVFLAARDQLYVSGLQRPSDALVVSRQIQLGLQGFRGRHGNGPVAVSIAIDSSSGDRPAAVPEGGVSPASTTALHRDPEPPHDLITLLKLSKPAQILLTHDLCQQMAGTKGLPLKPFPGRFGVYEYLWASQEKLDLLQSEPQLTLAALPTAETPKSATTGETGQPTAAGGRTKSFDLPKSPDGMVQEGQSPFQRPGIWGSRVLAPRNLIFAALGVAAIGAAIAVGIHMAYRPVAGSAPAAVAAPAQVMPASVSPAPAAPVQSGAVRRVPITKPHAGSTAGHEVRQSTNQALPAAEQTPVAATASGCAQGMDAGRLVRLGEQARGRGDYANAVRIFREVLACNPNDAAAREGLDKATRGAEQR
jgi:hypothetical protein